MAYRNATYIAFAADGETNPTKSDLKYYNILRARKELEHTNFNFINAHEKVSAVRDTSKADTIRASLRQRIQASKNMLLLLGRTTRLDTDFVPYEINYAVNICKLPIIVCYTEEKQPITDYLPLKLRALWPKLLENYINQNKVRTIHIPFREAIIQDAINRFNVNNQPLYSTTLYSRELYVTKGIWI
ncbi:hypothetical protein D3C76_569440 [compost metagenome]